MLSSRNVSLKCSKTIRKNKNRKLHNFLVFCDTAKNAVKAVTLLFWLKAVKKDQCFYSFLLLQQFESELVLTRSFQLILIDLDEYSSGRHSCDAGISTCVNTPGSFRCQCAAGYEKTTEHKCQDKWTGPRNFQDGKLAIDGQRDSVPARLQVLYYCTGEIHAWV